MLSREQEIKRGLVRQTFASLGPLFATHFLISVVGRHSLPPLELHHHHSRLASNDPRFLFYIPLLRPVRWCQEAVLHFRSGCGLLSRWALQLQPVHCPSENRTWALQSPGPRRLYLPDQKCEGFRL